MKTRNALCIHRRRRCAECRAFQNLVIAAVEGRETRWYPGVLADLNRLSSRLIASPSTR